MNKRIRIFLIVALVVLFLLGVLLMVYPLFSSWYSEQVRSEIQTVYKESVSTSNSQKLDEQFEAARIYNEGLYLKTFDALAPAENGYFDILDPAGTGIMGYITIPSIDVTLPIFHGTDSEVLEVGAGHMPQSSLPIGGNSTHAVITAHSGMASSPMFSDITLLVPGDIFQIDILGQTFTYEVQNPEDIRIVDPAQIDDIQILKDQDLCTLITCYPFGINTERYLVRGHRIDNPVPEETADTEPEEIPAENANSESVWKAQWQKSVIVGLGIAAFSVITCAVVMVVMKYHQAGRKRGRYE